MKRILLLYISEVSGHHCASLAIERALKQIDPSVETLNINSFNYTNPILERIINQTYMSVVKRTPELWDYLYDNPKVLKNTQRLRAMIHRFNKGKLKTLLEEFRPDAVVCTQAFPCGMIADYKKTFSLTMPLIGVLTDFAPHSYWVYNNVDRYIVPSRETGRPLIDNGVSPERVVDAGIPIDPDFMKPSDQRATYARLALDPGIPCILVMGGTQGLGPIQELVRLLDRSRTPIQVVVATGTNKRLYAQLSRRARQFRTPIRVLRYTETINELMDIAKIIITKPGGITTAEALAKGVPMLILNPLPGQEAMNTRHLLKEGVAIKAANPDDAIVLLEELLYNTAKLRAMSEQARALSKPASAVDIARLVLGLADR